MHSAREIDEYSILKRQTRNLKRYFPQEASKELTLFGSYPKHLPIT